ncbi:MAG: hypothetical protein ACRD3W_19375, partial [Terriglobales bacterium]
QLTVTEPGGAPFIQAKNSEIGIAIVPLLRKKLVIRHLEFDHPEIWAVRTAPNLWNFSDLLHGPDVRFIQCDSGTVHVADGSSKTPAWKPMDLNDVKVSFVWPRKHKKTPVYLAFSLPRGSYTSTLKLDGLRWDKGGRWQDDHYKFQLKTVSLNPDDFTAILQALMPAPAAKELQAKTARDEVKGLFDVTVDGDGILSKGMTAKIDAAVKNFTITTPTIGTMKAPQASIQANLSADEHKFAWQGLTLKLADIALQSEGELVNWYGSNDRSYKASIAGNFQDLSSLGKLVSYEHDALGRITEEKPKWAGKAEVQINLIGTNGTTKAETKIKAEDIVASYLIPQLPAEAKPIVDLLGIANDSKIKGSLRVVPGEIVEVKDAVVPLSIGKVQLNGQMDLANGTGKFVFNGRDLDFKGMEAKLNEQCHKQKNSALALAKGVNFKLDGDFGIDGIVVLKKKDIDYNGSIVLQKAQMGLSDGSLAMHNVTGKLGWQQDKVTYSGINGLIGADGTFQLDGTSVSGRTANLDLQLTAKHAQLEQLEAVLRTLKMELPILTQKQLFGRVKDLTLKASGKANSPNIYLAATPEDVFYQPPGLTRPLRAKSGSIIYDQDNLVLSDLGLLVRNDKVNTSVTIQNVSKTALVKNVTFKTAGLDLGDINYYLASPVMPPPLKKAYTDCLYNYRMNSLRGRIYGNGFCQIKGNDFDLDGSIGLINVGAKVADEQFPVEHVNG